MKTFAEKAENFLCMRMELHLPVYIIEAKNALQFVHYVTDYNNCHRILAVISSEHTKATVKVAAIATVISLLAKYLAFPQRGA